MNMKSRIISICTLLATIFLFSACSLWPIKTTWRFTNSAAGVDYIVVTPSGSADDSSFTLKYGDSHYVTWTVERNKKPKRGDFNYTAYTTKDNVDGAYYTDYESLEEVVFYTRYKN